MANKILLFLVLLFFSNQLIAQNNYNFSQAFDESVSFVKQPLNWEGNDWLKFGVISATTFLISMGDEPIREIIQKENGFTQSIPEKFGRLWGQGYASAAFAGAFGIHSLIANDKSTRKIAFEIIQATLYSGGIAQFLKFTLGRARPYTNEGNSSFKPFAIFNDSHYSFPSGDVTLAFALSSVLANNSKSDLVKIICYIPSVLTIASRVYRDAHWSSDVFFGAALGYFVGSWVTNLHDKNESMIQSSFAYPLSIKIKL